MPGQGTGSVLADVVKWGMSSYLGPLAPSNWASTKRIQACVAIAGQQHTYSICWHDVLVISLASKMDVRSECNSQRSRCCYSTLLSQGEKLCAVIDNAAIFEKLGNLFPRALILSGRLAIPSMTEISGQPSFANVFELHMSGRTPRRQLSLTYQAKNTIPP